MYRFLTIVLLTGLFIRPAFSQAVKRPFESRRSFSQDTALVNQYVHRLKQLPNVLTPEDIDTARTYLPKIYHLSQFHNYYNGLTEYYRISATVYNSLHQYDSSHAAIQKEFYWARKSTDPMGLAEAFASKGIWFETLDELDSAAACYIQAVAISDSVQDYHFSGQVYNNLAVIFYNISDAKNAEKYAVAGYHAGIKAQDSLTFISCLLNLAGIKKDLLNRSDTAMEIYEQVRKMVRHSTRFRSFAFNAGINEGDLLNEQKHYRKALNKYRSVMKHKMEIGDYMLGYNYAGIAHTLFMMKRYSQAEISIKKAIQINRDIHAQAELRNGYALLSNIKREQKQFDEALLYHEKKDSLNEILTDKAGKKDIHLLEIKYQTAKKDNQIAQQNLSLTQKQQVIDRKNMWMMIFIVGLLALILILIFSFRSYRHKKKLREQSLLTLKKQHEVNTLHAKMEAREEERNRIGQEMHDDIGSALTTILYLSDDLKIKPDKGHQPAVEQIKHLSKTVVDKMNEIIWSMNRQYDTLDDLIAYARQHAAEFLENYEIAHHFEVPDPVPNVHLQGEQRRNIYLVIKEALHNIVKHAQASEVHIIFQVDHSLTVTIHDNGKGFHPDKNSRFGNGLRNMQQRMEAAGGSFEIMTDQGTKIILGCHLNADSV